MVDRQEAIERATRALAESRRQPVAYGLGQGGFRPNMPFPWNGPRRQVDCSGFMAWVIGEPRQSPDIEWIETTRVWTDALGARKMFERVASPNIGDIWVWPDRGRIGRRLEGHMAMVWAMPNGRFDDLAMILHCSSGNWRRYQTAIEVSPADRLFKIATDRGAAFVRPCAWHPHYDLLRKAIEDTDIKATPNRPDPEDSWRIKS